MERKSKDNRENRVGPITFSSDFCNAKKGKYVRVILERIKGMDSKEYDSTSKSRIYG